MKLHEIKLNIEFCDAVYNGEKTFELRKNDRGYQKGDHIKFISVEGDCFPTKVSHNIEDCEYEITYVLNGWGLQEGYVALAIRRVDDGNM